MRCAGCFREIGQEQVCPLCGLDLEAEQRRRSGNKALPIMYRLAGKYDLGRMLGAGGFGITYLAKDITNGQLVAVKEFFPSEFCDRAGDGRVIPHRSQEAFSKSVQHFYEEAKTLYALGQCPSVAGVEGFFRGNNTSYIVMEYVRGESLKEFISKCGGRVPYNYAKHIIVQIALALSEVHSSGIVHSDISPANILMEPSGDVKLVDFGASRSFLNKSGETRTVQVKPGFTPPEQYTGSTLQLGPWTDIYALACTFYRMVTGKLPPEAAARKSGEEVTPIAVYVPEVEPRIEYTIARAMELDYNKRYRTADEFIADFTDYAVQDNSTDLKNTDGTKFIETKGNLFDKLKKAVKQMFGSADKTKRQGAQAYIDVIEGMNRGARLVLEPGRQYLIGRQEDMCDLVVSNNSVISRVHCAVKFDSAEGTVTIYDKSSNGVTLGDGRSLGGGSAVLSTDCMAALSEGEVILNIVINKNRGNVG